MTTDTDEDNTLLRVRTLRRDGYRCQYRERPQEPICGAYGNKAGHRPTDNEYVALCLVHEPQEASYVQPHH